MLRKIIFCAVFTMTLCHAENKLDLLFPGPNFIEGWTWDGSPKHYTPDNLYDYIDGEAELFHDYGFLGLSVLTYYKDSHEDTFFVVNIYDMGTDINAFGLYSTFRYPGYDFDSIGVESIVSDYGLKFYLGQYYIDIGMGDATESIQNAARFVANMIVKNIDVPAQPPDFLSLLPSDNQVEKTLRYVASGMLNQTFLPEGIEAQYQLNGEEAIGFVIRCQSSSNAIDCVDKLKAFFEDAKTIQNDLLRNEVTGIETPYHGVLLCSVENQYIYGVQDVDDIQPGILILESIQTNLRQKLD